MIARRLCLHKMTRRHPPEICWKTVSPGNCHFRCMAMMNGWNAVRNGMLARSEDSFNTIDRSVGLIFVRWGTFLDNSSSFKATPRHVVKNKVSNDYAYSHGKCLCAQLRNILSLANIDNKLFISTDKIKWRYYRRANYLTIFTRTAQWSSYLLYVLDGQNN